MYRRLYLLFLVFLVAVSVSFASTKVKPVNHPLVAKYDSSAVSTRSFDPAALKNYRQQPEFKYDEVDGHPSLWTRFWRWFWNWLKGFLNFHVPKNASLGFVGVVLLILKFLLLGAALAGIIYVILKMAGVDAFNIFRRRAKSASQPYSESLENIHDINFDGAIEEALSNHNYRLAVRLLYLKSLKQLSDASLIKWQPEKTNSSYINELTDGEHKNIFKSLTRRFEYVWYGEFPIDAPAFTRINELFQEFKGKIA